MLTGPYFVLIDHQWVDQSDSFLPTAWMGRHITTTSAMHQARFLAGWFQKVRVWDAKDQKLVATYLQYVPLERDDLDPGHVEFYKTTLERPEGKVQTMGKRVIYAFNRHDRNADYEVKREAKRHSHSCSDESESNNSEDIQSVDLG